MILPGCSHGLLDLQRATGLRINLDHRARGGFGSQEIPGRIHNASTGPTGRRPFSDPHHAQVAVETVEIGDSGKEAVRVFAHVNAHRTAHELGYRGCERGTGASWQTFAGELTKRTINHGQSWSGKRHRGIFELKPFPAFARPVIRPSKFAALPQIYPPKLPAIL